MEATSRADDPRDVAFDRYVVPEVEVLLRVALGLTPQRADAEDLVQDTLIRAYRAIGSFDGRYPRAWLLTILRNTHLNRSRRWRPDLLRDPEGMRSRVEAVPDEDPRTPEDVEGLSYAEAAQALGVPAGTVMSRLHRARRRIRTRLAAAGVAPRAGRR